MERRIVVGSVGMPCAGKGEAASVAEKKFGFRIFKFRTVVEEEARRLGIDEGPLTLTKTGTLLRKREGPGAIARRVAAKIRRMRDGRIFVEGIRSYPEIRLLKRAFPGSFHSMGIVSPKRARLMRALSRRRWDDPRTMAQLERKDATEASWGVVDALSKSDVLITNDGHMSEFRRLVTCAIKNILKEGTHGKS